ncbi:hypothetical protein [Verrucomicrobium sp. BvORR106]|uniref:hypothetical protein n=1 Tax=Verrucomicrobium sp. BvORR106 TaxID=1403819 RepID=UPI00056F30E7|nr:hypothetical protein [Verrucomicrobium sp. BvORR106]
MSNQDEWMKEVVAGVHAAPADPKVKREARRRALAALGDDRPEPARNVPVQAWMLISTVTVAVALVVLAADALLFHESKSGPAGRPQLLTEMEKLFPRQLDAVIRDGDKVDVELLESPRDTAADQRILVTLHDKGRKIEVFTYSGHEVCLDRAGAHVCFTPLLTGDGAVLVVTDGMVMQSPDEATLAGFHWSAQSLPEVAS